MKDSGPDERDVNFMRRAIQLAQRAEAEGEVPVGAVVVQEREIVGEGSNKPISSHDPTAHAEIVALRNAGRAAENYRLSGATVYVTLEPCPMCLGAMMQARVKRVVFGASDPKTGALGGAADLSESAAFKHGLEVAGGVLAAEAGSLLREFFAARR